MLSTSRRATPLVTKSQIEPNRSRPHPLKRVVPGIFRQTKHTFLTEEESEKPLIDQMTHYKGTFNS
jgi:hypothetical protein